MYIRCRECWGSTWVAPTESGLPRRRLHCAQCEREHRLDNLNSIGTTPAARHTAAVSCAERHELDLPTAYSVLLRLVDLAEAKRHCASLGEAHTELNYDWGFRGAVTAGYLSEAQAIERGNRETYATRLAERHGLPLSLAFSVADNRMGLGEARRRRQRRQEPAPAEPRWSFVALLRDVPRWQIGLAIAALCLSSFQLLKSRSGSRALEPLPLPAEVLHEPVVDVGAAKEAVRRPSPAAVVVERNSEGEIVRVAGPDPRSVLITYCRSAGGNTHLRPVEVTSAVPAFAGTRLGMLRDLARVNELLAVRIRRDRRTRRWVAGDGRHAINPFQAPTLPPDAHRLPVGS